MTSGQLMIAELLLVLGVTLGFGFHQLWSLKRERIKDAEKAKREDANLS